jgi:hypothetical protein
MTTLDLTTTALPITQATLDLQSFAPSTLQLSLPITDPEASSPLDTSETYKVTTTAKDGTVTTHLIGTITEVTRTNAASGAPNWTVTISDYYYQLQTTIWLSNNTDELTTTIYRTISSSSEDDTTNATTPLSDALRHILSVLPSKYIPLEYKLDLSNASYLIPFTIDNSKISELLDNIREWDPRLTARIVYPDDVPTLLISNAVTTATLDTETTPTTSISLTPRPDLIPPVVAVLATLNTSTSTILSTRAKYPADVDLATPGAQIITTTLPTDTKDDDGNAVDSATPVQQQLEYNAPFVQLKGAAFPSLTDHEAWVKWWQKHVPTLQQLKEGSQLVAANTTVTILDPPNEDAEGYEAKEVQRYEWLSGEYNGRAKGFKWQELQITTPMLAKTVPDGLKGYFHQLTSDGYWRGEMVCKVRACNHYNKKYYLDHDSTWEDGGDGEDSDDDNTDVSSSTLSEANATTAQYKKLVREYWEANQVLQHQGSISVAAAPVYTPGTALNITGRALPSAYKELNTSVQSVSWDVTSNTTTYTTGPAETLTLQNAMSRANALYRQAQNSCDNGTGAEAQAAMSGGSVNYTMPSRKRPASPTIGPAFSFNPPSGQRAKDADFAVRGVYDHYGNITSLQWHSGTVIAPAASKKIGDADWNNIDLVSALYVNVIVNTDGTIMSASVSSAESPEQKGVILQRGIDPLTGHLVKPTEETVPAAAGKTTISNIKLATVDTKTGAITTNHQGSITISPEYTALMHITTDLFNDHVCNKSKTPQGKSLINQRCETYTLLNSLVAKQPLKLVANVDDATLTLSLCSCSCSCSTNAYICSNYITSGGNEPLVIGNCTTTTEDGVTHRYATLRQLVAGERIRLSQTPDGHGVVIDALCQDIPTASTDINLDTDPVRIWFDCDTYQELSLYWQNDNTIGLTTNGKRSRKD